MKFGKRLKAQIEDTLPEWKDKFLAYKELKKQLRSLSPPQCSSHVSREEYPSKTSDAQASQRPVQSRLLVANEEGTVYQRVVVFAGVRFLVEDDRGKNIIPGEEVAFIQRLDNELDKMNDFFLEKLEDYGIKLYQLKTLLSEVGEEEFKKQNCSEDAKFLKAEIVPFLGELILLLGYSNLNAYGMYKILKKHDKLSSLPLFPLLQLILKQDFYDTEDLRAFLKTGREMTNSIFQNSSEPIPAPSNNDPTRQNMEQGQQQNGEDAAGNRANPNSDIHERIFRNTRAMRRTFDAMNQDDAVAMAQVMAQIVREVNESSVGHDSAVTVALDDSDSDAEDTGS